jgi:hypothetical protein
MSWFGGGSKKDDASSGGGEKSFDMGESLGDSVALSAAAGGGGGGGSLADIQQFGQQLQQQILIQQAITDMSDRAFIKCITG